MNDEYGVYFRPDLAAIRVQQTRSALIWRLATTGIAALAVGLAWVFWPEPVGSWAPWFLGSSLVVAAVFGGHNWLQYAAARRDSRAATPGLAIGLNRDGILVGPQWFTWPEVGALVVRPGRFGGSAQLVATGRDQANQTLPLDYTDILPATLDSAVRTLSAGRAWVDLSRLD